MAKRSMVLTLTLGLWLASAAVVNASVSPALLNAKSEAEARGYIFVTSHDEIVSRAKKEGKVKVISSLQRALKPMAAAFKKKYPFVDIEPNELESGPEAAQRFLLEVKAGAAKVDANRLFTEFYEEFLPYQKKIDILGMARHGVLDIPADMIDPTHRNVVAVGSQIHVAAYNSRLIAPDRVPDKWEDFLRTEFKGKKFGTDIRPVVVASLVPAWGLEKTLEFARKIAAQQPVWGKGHTRLITSALVGEIPLVLGTVFGSVNRAKQKDRAGVLGLKVLEPVTGRLYLTDGVFAKAESPYSSLLWLEFQASPAGQKILDEHWPFGASVLSPESVQAKQVSGKKLFLIDWNHYTKLDSYVTKVVEAYGFPTETK